MIPLSKFMFNVIFYMRFGVHISLEDHTYINFVVIVFYFSIRSPALLLLHTMIRIGASSAATAAVVVAAAVICLIQFVLFVVIVIVIVIFIESTSVCVCVCVCC